MVFRVFGSTQRPRIQQEAQETPKRHPRNSKTSCKNIPEKIWKNESLVKNALSRRSQKQPFLEPRFNDQTCSFSNNVNTIWKLFFFKHTETHIEAHFENRAAKGGRDKPKTKHQELQRTKNLHIQKP